MDDFEQVKDRRGVVNRMRRWSMLVALLLGLPVMAVLGCAEKKEPEPQHGKHVRVRAPHANVDVYVSDDDRDDDDEYEHHHHDRRDDRYDDDDDDDHDKDDDDDDDDD